MGCSNCFSGCSTITSDQCVKYTGADIASLEISNGDPLSTVISKLSTFLISSLDGSGITPDVNDTCDLMATYLGAGTTLNDFISALIQAACDLQTQIDAIDSTLTTLDGDYDVDCLAGVTDSSNTHDVLQAVIVKLCATEDTLTALANTVSTNYVALADLNTLIDAHLATLSSTTMMSSRMVPYVAMPYFGSLTYFDATGAGTGAWANIYLCNGRNGTPDMRGRVPVCATSGMLGGTYNSAVDPAISGNPNYSLNDVGGANTVALSTSNMPSHTHVTTVNLNDPLHTHYTVGNAPTGTNLTLSSSNYIKSLAGDISNPSSGNYSLQGTATVASIGKTSGATSGVSVNSVTTSYAGGGTAHNNIQPVIAAYYIMYRPS